MNDQRTFFLNMKDQLFFYKKVVKRASRDKWKQFLSVSISICTIMYIIQTIFKKYKHMYVHCEIMSLFIYVLMCIYNIILSDGLYVACCVYSYMNKVPDLGTSFLCFIQKYLSQIIKLKKYCYVLRQPYRRYMFLLFKEFRFYYIYNHVICICSFINIR